MYEFSNTKRELREHLKHPCIGDLEVEILLNHYLEQRNKILSYSGKSAVDARKYSYYESILFKDEYRMWFSHYSKAGIDRNLWLLRRLKVGILPQDEYNLIDKYYDRMPTSELIFAIYLKDGLSNDVRLYNYFKSNGVVMNVNRKFG